VSPLRRRDRAAAEAVGRITAAARAFENHGIEYIHVRQVLDLADPQGEWARDTAPLTAADFRPRQPAPRQPAMPAPAPPDSKADPLTGCMPVTAQQKDPAD
jgi:hypothetical protein